MNEYEVIEMRLAAAELKWLEWTDSLVQPLQKAQHDLAATSSRAFLGGMAVERARAEELSGDLCRLRNEAKGQLELAEVRIAALEEELRRVVLAVRSVITMEERGEVEFDDAVRRMLSAALSRD